MGEKMICSDCGEEKPDVEEVIDPFIEELYGEKVKTKLCSDCYRESIFET